MSIIRNLSLACLMVLGGSTVPAVAQDRPTRFITMIVPFGTGSASDTVARIVAPRLWHVLGQQVVVENVGGAGGTIGTTLCSEGSALMATRL